MTRQTLPYFLSRTIHRANRRINVRKLLATTPSLLLLLASVLFLAAVINFMVVAK